MAVGPEVTVGSVAVALGSTAGVVSLFCICGLVYWYCVRPRARHKRSRKSPGAHAERYYRRGLSRRYDSRLLTLGSFFLSF